MKVDWDELKRLHEGRDAFKIMALIPAILAERETAQTIPPGYALVPVEQVKDARLLAWLLEKHGEQIRQILWSYDQCCSDEINALGVKAMLTAAAKGE